MKRDYKILCIDDSRTENTYYDIFRHISNPAEIRVVRNSSDAISFMEKVKEADLMPDIIVFDTCAWASSSQRGRDLDESWGEENAATIFDWLNKSGVEVRPKSLFLSADEELVVETANIMSKRLNSDFYPFTEGEAKLVNQYLSQSIITVDSKTSGFRKFMNEIFDFQIPETKEELDNYKLRSRRLNVEDAINYVENGTITKSDALSFVEEDIKNLVEDLAQSRIAIADNEKNTGIIFDQSTKIAINGTAVFSIEAAKQLYANGGSPILISDDYNADYVSSFKMLAGVVIINPQNTGHIKLLLDGYEKAGLLGASKIDVEKYPYLKDIEGKQLRDVIRIEERDGKKCLVDYKKEIYSVADKYSKKLKEIGLTNKPDLFADLSDITPQKVVTEGDDITISETGMLYKGKYNVYKRELYPKDNKVINAVMGWLDEEHKDMGIKRLNFKINLDTPIYETNNSSFDGIGLLRSEHFTLASESRKRHFISAIINQDEESFDRIKNDMDSSLSLAFYQKDEVVGKPKRIRLMDMPIRELSLSPENLQKFSDLYSGIDTRGVQLAEMLPDLYRSEIEGIFMAMDRMPKYMTDVEIMVPTVKTVEELRFVKSIVNESAQKYGISSSKYKFGSMVETLSAVENIEDIAKECDFVSIGTNDLTSELYDCPREDTAKREAITKEEGVDPFTMFTMQTTKLINDIAKNARKANPEIKVDSCGNHVNNSTNLNIVALFREDEALDGVSLPANITNLLRLRVNYEYDNISYARITKDIKYKSARQLKP